MDEATAFREYLKDYFQNDELVSIFITILSRLKKKDATVKLQKKNTSILVVSYAGTILRVDKRYNGFAVKITGSLFDYIALDVDHMNTICSALKISDKGFEKKDALQSNNQLKANEFKAYRSGDSIFKKSKQNNSDKQANNKNIKEQSIEIENDITVKCADCGKTFVFTKGEADYFNKMGFSIPKRCKSCRERRKHIEKDYYEIGLKKNTSQQNLNTWGMIAEFNGPAQNEGFTGLY